MTPEDTIAQINLLIETNKDGEAGYRAAADHVRNPELKAVFQDYSAQRVQFALALRAEIERLEGKPLNPASVKPPLDRGWLDVKSALSGGDGSAIVTVCESGEKLAVATYQGVLNMDVTGQTRWLIEGQFRHIQQAHNHLSRLKEHKSDADYPKRGMATGRG